MSSEINNRNLSDWIVIKMMFWQGGVAKSSN